MKKEIKENKLVLNWLSIPLSLKLVFIIVLVGLGSSTYLLSLTYNGGYSFFGFDFLGVKALLLSLVIDIFGSIAVLVSIWFAKKWGFGYTLGYFGFLILNGILSVIALKQRIDAFGDQFGGVPAVHKALFMEVIISGIVGFSIYLLILILITRNKKYFEK